MNDKVGEIVADMGGGKHEKRSRMANFVAECAAAGLWSAAIVAQVRREYGSELLLRRIRSFAAANGRYG